MKLLLIIPAIVEVRVKKEVFNVNHKICPMQADRTVGNKIIEKKGLTLFLRGQ